MCWGDDDGVRGQVVDGDPIQVDGLSDDCVAVFADASPLAVEAGVLDSDAIEVSRGEDAGEHCDALPDALDDDDLLWVCAHATGTAEPVGERLPERSLAACLAVVKSGGRCAPYYVEKR